MHPPKGHRPKQPVAARYREYSIEAVAGTPVTVPVALNVISSVVLILFWRSLGALVAFRSRYPDVVVVSWVIGAGLSVWLAVIPIRFTAMWVRVRAAARLGPG